MKKLLLSVWEIAEVLIVASASIFIIYGFIAQPFLVQGKSMEPNFYEGSYLIVDEITYRFRDPKRGEVVVFVNPQNDSEFYIKRIIGLPGEKIEIKDEKIYINGVEYKEDYLPSDAKFGNNVSWSLKNDQYFVMGDNRSRSSDSRYWGPLDREKIVGAVRLRFWPPTAVKFFYTK